MLLKYFVLFVNIDVRYDVCFVDVVVFVIMLDSVVVISDLVWLVSEMLAFFVRVGGGYCVFVFLFGFFFNLWLGCRILF